MKQGKEIVNWIKENYKIIIPLALILVIFIAFLIYYKVSILNNITKETTEPVYQYFQGKRYNYNAIITTNRRNIIIDLKTSDYDIEYDATPIYYKDKKRVIFPKDMSVIMPTLNCSEYLSLGYSELIYTKKNYNLKTKNYNGKLGHYFLYDGNNLYFFIEETTLIIGNEKIKLTPLSYVIASPNQTITYYNKESDIYQTIEANTDTTTVENDYYKIYPTRDTLDYYGENVLLTSKIDELNTIDNKEKNK